MTSTKEAEVDKTHRKMKTKSEKMRILTDIRSISGLARLCAILPYVKGKGKKAVVSKSGRLYSFTVCAILILVSVGFSVDVLFHAKHYKILKSKQGDTEEINQTIETLFCIISYTMIVVSCVNNAVGHFSTYKDIAKIDEFLEANGFNGSYSCPFIAAVLFLVSLGVIGVAFYFVHIRSVIPVSRQIVLMMAYSLQMLLSCVFAIYIRVLLKNITRRIEFVNKKLEGFIIGPFKENWLELSKYIEIFCKFRYITENINSTSGVALLFYMGYAFYTVTNQSYLAFSILTTHVAFIDKYDSIILSVTLVIAEITTMSVICSSCDDMSSEILCPYFYFGIFDFNLPSRRRL